MKIFISKSTYRNGVSPHFDKIYCNHNTYLNQILSQPHGSDGGPGVIPYIANYDIGTLIRFVNEWKLLKL